MSDSLGNFSIVCLEKDVVQIKPKGFQPENNNYCKFPDMYALLKAKLGPTMYVDNSGAIRHKKGLNSSSGMYPPVVVVNGQIQPTGIYWIKPCNVRSIEVLKGSEASIYGRRGENDVVVITTKQ